MDILKTLEQTGAHLQGHFLLSSGLHSDHYFQCARLLQYPEHAEAAGKALAGRISADIHVVVAPAMGGIIIGHEVARALGVRFVFAERAGAENKLTFRRGFEIQKGEKVLLVEDVVTTGKSVLELQQLVQDHGGQCIAFASIVDRSNGQAGLDLPWEALTTIQVNTYRPEDCPMCKEGTEAVKPGSRKKFN
jgi:orotate phosphoribosyltransferase